jgi:stress-induced morphogen
LLDIHEDDIDHPLHDPHHSLHDRNSDFNDSSVLHPSHSKEAFQISAASVDGNVNEFAAWNDINSLMINEAAIFDLDNPSSLDLLNEEEIAYQSKIIDQSPSHSNNNTPGASRSMSKISQQMMKPSALVDSNNSHQSSPQQHHHLSPMMSPLPSGAGGGEEHFMVEIICKRFLQLFLVGVR